MMYWAASLIELALWVRPKLGGKFVVYDRSSFGKYDAFHCRGVLRAVEISGDGSSAFDGVFVRSDSHDIVYEFGVFWIRKLF
jgi:hypothetical protein